MHVALIIDGVASIGAVALPPANQTLRIVVSRTRPAAQALAVATALGAELLPMGSAGAKAMAVVWAG